jgi:hypothetical protein
VDPSFVKLQAAVVRELSILSAADLERHPGGDPARWNARQIVEHLLLTYRLSGKVFTERLAKGRPTLAQVNRRQLIARFMVLRLGRFPGRPLAPANVTPSTIPCEMVDGSCLAEQFAVELQVMDELLGRCEEQFARNRFATHQILGPLCAEEWRRFHVVHSRHHLKQIVRTKSL